MAKDIDSKPKCSTYDEDDIDKMGAMIIEVTSKLQQAMDVQTDLSLMLYGSRRHYSLTTCENECCKEKVLHSKEEVPPGPKEVTVVMPVEGDNGYAFCRSIDTVLWHIRKMTKKGKLPWGHTVSYCDTRSLCDVQVLWDEIVQVNESNMKDNGCLQCATEYRRRQGEEYANRKKS